MRKMVKGTLRPVPLWYQYENSDRKSKAGGNSKTPNHDKSFTYYLYSKNQGKEVIISLLGQPTMKLQV